METLVNNTSAEAIEQQFNEKMNRNVNHQSFTFDPKIYLDTKIPDKQNSKQIRLRILPVSGTDPNVFLKLKTHSLKVDKEIANSGFKSFICLNDEHIKEREPRGCPLCQKAKELFDKAKEYRSNGDDNMSKVLYKQACTFKCKTTYIVRVIVRGHEDEGVKFWRFNENSKGEGCYDKLMSIYNTRREPKPDGGMYNLFDLVEGKDIVLTLNRVFDTQGKDTGKISYQITDANFSTPLSNDIMQANEWINDSKKWTDAYGIKQYDYLKIISEGKIPVRDHENGGYSSKEVKTNDANQREQENARIAREILSEHQEQQQAVEPQTSSMVNNPLLHQTPSPQTPLPFNGNDPDLPF